MKSELDLGERFYQTAHRNWPLTLMYMYEPNSLLKGPIKICETAIGSLFHKLQFEYNDIVWRMFEKFDLLTLRKGRIKICVMAIDSLFHKLQFQYKHDIVWTMFEKFDLLTSNSLRKGPIKNCIRQSIPCFISFNLSTNTT